MWADARINELLCKVFARTEPNQPARGGNGFTLIS